MAVPRPLLLALIAAVLAAVTFYAAVAARDQRRAGTPAASTRAHDRPDAPAQQPRPAERQAGRGTGEARRSVPRPKRGAPTPAASRGLPRAVTAALARRHVVVLAFLQRGAADDEAAADAVAALRRRRGAVSVFSDRIERVGRYRRIVAGVKISQAPAIVVVDRDRRARVIEGFVDAQTLAQAVADSR